MKYLAVQSENGMRLEEVNPYEAIIIPNSFTPRNTENLKKWLAFEKSKRSFLTDDPRVVVGQQYEAGEYELIEQANIIEIGGWKDVSKYYAQVLGYDSRQILRRKAEGEKAVKTTYLELFDHRHDRVIIEKHGDDVALQTYGCTLYFSPKNAQQIKDWLNSQTFNQD